VGSRLTDFFHRFADVENTPEDRAIRDLTVSTGGELANSLRSMRRQLAQLGEDTDGEIADRVARADDIARQVAELNSQITTGEAGRRGQATALRDQRDALLRELSELVDVIVREQPDGEVNVYIGSEALVQAAVSRGLIAITETDGEFQRTSVRFADTQQQVEVRGGRLQGLVIARDQDAYGRMAALDQLAAALIQEVNRIHADGQGLTGLENVTGSYEVLAVDAALDGAGAGLEDAPRQGSFFVTVADNTTHTPVAYRIDVRLDGTSGGATLQTLVDDINDQVIGVTAAITSDRRLSLTADPGMSFTFGHDGQHFREDSSGVLAALGINTFFTGDSAANIGVNEALQADSSRLAAASVFLPGDGANAARIATLDITPSGRLGGVSVTAYHNAVANQVAVAAAAVNADVEATSAVLSSLQSQKEAISGVNLDEEAIALLKYERSFQGATRYITVIERLLGELVALIR
jgi:flagellar hook-associated protein 1 FlgK